MAESFSVKINFVDVSTFSGDVMEFVVDSNVFLPTMFTILIRDEVLDPLSGALKYTDNQLLFKVGAPVEISVKTNEIPGSLLPVRHTLVKGEITAIEPVFDNDGNVMLRIRGFDRGHRLTIGKHTRTFGDANPIAPTLTDMQIVTMVAKDVGLIPEVDISGLAGVMYHYVMQYDQSDWDFLWTRAQQLGYQVYVDDKSLHFKKAGATRNLLPIDSPATLSWGSNLSRFEPRIVSMSQVNSASAYGWDPKTKTTVTSKSRLHTSATAAKIADPLYGSASLVTGYFISQAEDAVMTPEAETPTLAKKYADARFAEHHSDFVRASGEVKIGDPRLLAGTKVIIKDVGIRFAGEYYVTEAKHVFRRGAYTVKFEVSGRNPYTIRHLLVGKDTSAGKINGVVIGVVTDTLDPQKQGRIKVKYPWMPKNGVAELSSNWARLASPSGGKNRGIFFTPEINDEVLVAFDQGDVNRPYVVGVLWNARDLPPSPGAVVNPGTKTTDYHVIQSRSGHVIILNDTQGQEQIVIKDKTQQNSIIIDSKTNAMTIKTQGDLTFDAGGKITMKSKMDFSVESNAQVSVKAQTNMNMEAHTKAALKSGPSELDLQASGSALKGTKVDIQGTAQASIQGAQTSVKGSAMVEVQGALVKIN